MNNFISFPDDAHMYDIALIVIKKGEVAGCRFVHKAQRSTCFYLLTGVPGQRYTNHFVEYLSQTAAINSQGRTSSPKIRGIKIFQCLLNNDLTWIFEFPVKNLSG